MSRDWAAQEALDTEHTIRPQPGDLWEEMLCVQFLVVWTDGEFIEYLDAQEHRVPAGDNEWTWDTAKPLKRSTVEEFARMLHYSTPSMAHKCWASVHPGCMLWAVRASLDARKRRAP